MLKQVTVALIQGYRKHISPRKKRPCCRFYPSCSSYAIVAIEEYGFFLGAFRALSRILRCHPLGKEGIDPVPIRHRTKGAGMMPSSQEQMGREYLLSCLYSQKGNR